MPYFASLDIFPWHFVYNERFELLCLLLRIVRWKCKLTGQGCQHVNKVKTRQGKLCMYLLVDFCIIVQHMCVNSTTLVKTMRLKLIFFQFLAKLGPATKGTKIATKISKSPYPRLQQLLLDSPGMSSVSEATLPSPQRSLLRLSRGSNHSTLKYSPNVTE